MTSGMDSTQAGKLLAAAVGQAALTAFGGTTGKLKLLSALGGTPETTAGTEIATGGGYSAGGFATGTSTSYWGAPSYSGGVSTVANASATTITSMPAVTVNAAELWDTAGTPLRWWYGTLTAAPVTTNSGDTLTFAIGAIQMTLTI